MGLMKEIIDVVTANLANDLMQAAKRRLAATGVARHIEKRLNPEQLHGTTRTILCESLAKVLTDLDDSDGERWKALFAHPENRQQMVRWVLEWHEEVAPDLGEWSLENAPNPDMLRPLLLRLHATIQEKKRKHFPPEFFNLQQGHAEILGSIQEASKRTHRMLEERLPTQAAEGHHREIDSAARYLQEEKPDTALDLLQRLERDKWGSLTDREKYRVRANIGHALRVMGKPDEAAESYLSARQFQPHDENARWMEALAYSLQGDTTKAHDLADALRRDFPEFTRATAVWVGSTAADVAFSDIESDVPERHRDDAEVASSLAQQASIRRQWQAAEGYARKAMEQEPDWIEPKLQLGSILLGSQWWELRRAGAASLTPEQAGGLRESVRLLSEVIGQLPGYTPAAEVARIRAELATVYRILGERDKAAEALIAGYAMAPDEPGVRYSYAVHLMESDQADQAIELLMAIPVRDMKEAYLLAQSLATRDKEGDRDAATGLLSLTDEDLRNAQEKEAKELRTEWARTLVRLHLAGDDGDAAESVLVGPLGNWLSPEDRLVFKAGVALAKRDQTEAVESSDEAIAALTDETEPCVIRQLALVLHRMGRYPESLELWRRLAQPGKLSQDSDYLMDCADRSGRQDVVLEFCSKLREAQVWDRRYITAELSILEDISPQIAMEVLIGLQDAPLESALKRELRVWLSCLAIRLERSDLVDSDSAHLPQITEVRDARTGRAVVEVLRAAGQDEQAVEYAYRLFRRFPDQLDAHMAVVSAVFLGKPKLDEPKAVEPGTAVRYKEDDSGREVWVILEDSAEPKPMLCEQSPDSPLAQAMLGKECGDQFLLRDRPRRPATIQQIVSKYVYRVRKCADEMESNFSGSAPMVTFHVPTKSDGTVDAAKGLEQMAEFYGDSTKAEELYLQELMPLHALGRHQGSSDFEMVQGLACRMDMKLRCCVGAHQERQAAFASMDTAQAIIIDPTALGTLHLLQAGIELNVKEFLLAMPMERIVSEHAVLMIRQLLQAKLREPGDRLGVEVTRGEAAVRRTPAEEMQRAKELVEQLLAAIEAACAIAPGRELAATGIDDKKTKDTVTQLFGRAGFHSVLLARTPTRILCTDDLASAVMLCSHLGVRRTWSQAVFFWMADRGHLNQDVEREATLLLLLGGYEFTSLRADHVMLAGEKADWDVDAPRLQALWKHFGNAAVDLPSRFRLASAVLKEVWQTGHLGMRAQAIAGSVLAALASAQGGGEVIEALLQNADRIFGIDVVNAAAFKQTIVKWLSGEGRIIVP